jgi:hypothetical protein
VAICASEFFPRQFRIAELGSFSMLELRISGAFSRGTS